MKKVFQHQLIGLAFFMLVQGVEAKTREDYTWITLPGEYIAEATQTVLYLSDIVEGIKGPNADYIARIVAVPLMDVPEAGKSQRLAHHQIILALRKARIDTLDIQFTGNKLVEVYGPGQWVERSDMVETIEQSILNEMGLSKDEIRLQVISSPAADYWLPPGEYEIHVDRINPHILGTSRYNLRFIQNRIMTGEQAFLVNIARKRPVFMPADHYPRGMVIHPQHLREEIQFIDQEAKDQLYIDRMEDIVGKKFRNTARQSDIITHNMVETNYIVKRGETVQAVLQNENFSMQTAAKTESRGAPGDIIPIKMLVTGKVLNAKVLNSNLVQIITR